MTRRADARRNREAILTAARTLVGEHGATGLRIADVAAASGVGAGSIYRAMGSKSGLLLALLDDDERALQQQMISGPPPLGPGAPPSERLSAFVTALHELVVRRRELLVAADDTSALAHTRTAVHAGWATHLRLLLAELLPADADVQIAAELLLAALSAPTYVHILDDLARTPADLHRELHRLLQMITDQGRHRHGPPLR